MTEAIERANPVKYLFGHLDISMREFERKHDVSHSAMMQLTSGGFRKPLVRVQLALQDELALRGFAMSELLAQAYGTADLGLSYDLWKKMHREEWALHNSFPRVVANGKTRPVKRWIDDGWGGPTAFAKSLAVPYTMVLNWYRGARRGIPGEIKRALDDADWSWHGLDDAERRWRERAAAKEQG